MYDIDKVMKIMKGFEPVKTDDVSEDLIPLLHPSLRDLLPSGAKSVVTDKATYSAHFCGVYLDNKSYETQLIKVAKALNEFVYILNDAPVIYGFLGPVLSLVEQVNGAKLLVSYPLIHDTLDLMDSLVSL